MLSDDRSDGELTDVSEYVSHTCAERNLVLIDLMSYVMLQHLPVFYTLKCHVVSQHLPKILRNET